MRCPFCGHDEDKVIDSRPADDGAAIRRRRECINCGNRFTTYEKIENLPLMVIKKDGSRQPFNRDMSAHSCTNSTKFLASRRRSADEKSTHRRRRPQHQ